MTAGKIKCISLFSKATGSKGPLGFTDPKTNLTKQPLITTQNLETDFDEEADIVPTPEEQAMLRKLRAERIAKEKGKSKESDEDEHANAKKLEANALKLKAIKLRREELELEEKALRALLEETEGAKSFRKENQVHVEEDESIDSNSHHRRRRTKVALTSDSDQEEGEDMSRTRLSRMEKPCLGTESLTVNWW
ncbi:hypothetical protein AgCh_025668 [Apium graveolens]